MIRLLLIILTLLGAVGCQTISRLENRIVPPIGTPKTTVDSVFGESHPFRAITSEVVHFYVAHEPVFLEAVYDDENKVRDAYLNTSRSVLGGFTDELAEVVSDEAKKRAILKLIDAKFADRPWD